MGHNFKAKLCKVVIEHNSLKQSVDQKVKYYDQLTTSPPQLTPLYALCYIFTFSTI